MAYEFGVDCSSFDSFDVVSGACVWLAAVELVELLPVEFVDAVEFVDTDCVLTLGLCVTPITRTVELPKLEVFISMDGAVVAPNTNGIVACAPFTESTVIFGKPF